MNGTKLIETDRLVLRKVTMNDAHDLFINWASDIKTNEYLTFKCHDNEEITKKVISYWLKKYEENGFMSCGWNFNQCFSQVREKTVCKYLCFG